MKAILFVAVIISAAIAAVVDLTPENFDSIVDGSKAAFVEFYAPWCGHCKSLAPAYEQVGEVFEKFKDSVVIAKVDADAHKELGGRFDVRGFPTLKFFPKGSTNPEAYEGGRSADDIVEFVNNRVGLKGKIKKAVSAVVDLDNNNFDKIVKDSNKDVLVEFYAPWCGHCKNLAPDYEKVAAAFAGEENVVVAKIDADKYKEIAGKFGVTGFPTIKWFPKAEKATPEPYDGARDVQSFVNYINRKAGVNRLANGRLAETAGRIAALDTLATKFVSAAADARAAIIDEAQKAVDALTEVEQKIGKLYVKTMSSIASNAGFVAAETSRLARMLEGSLAAKKIDEFTVRMNILSAFNKEK